MTEFDAVPSLRPPGDLPGLRRRRRSGSVESAEASDGVTQVDDTVIESQPESKDDVPATGSADDTAPTPGRRTLGRRLVERLVAVVASFLDELRPKNLAKVFEPMKAIPEHPVLYRSGWVELAVLVPASLIIVALELVILL